MNRRLIDICRLCYKENRTDITKVCIQSILVDITLKALDVSLICSYYPVA